LTLAFLGCVPEHRPSVASSYPAGDDAGPALHLDSAKVRNKRNFRAILLDSAPSRRIPRDSIQLIRAQYRIGEVEDAQERLAKLGYGVRITGEMDSVTADAIRRFEKRHGLPVTGDPAAATFRWLLTR